MLHCRRRKDSEHALIREQGHYRSMERLRKGYTTAVRKKKSIKHAAGVDVTTHTLNPNTKEVRKHGALYCVFTSVGLVPVLAWRCGARS